MDGFPCNFVCMQSYSMHDLNIEPRHKLVKLLYKKMLYIYIYGGALLGGCRIYANVELKC